MDLIHSDDYEFYSRTAGLLMILYHLQRKDCPICQVSFKYSLMLCSRMANIKSPSHTIISKHFHRFLHQSFSLTLTPFFPSTLLLAYHCTCLHSPLVHLVMSTSSLSNATGTFRNNHPHREKNIYCQSRFLFTHQY